MKNRKTEFRFFPIPEWKKEEKYLREQHKNGWQFVSVSGFCLYHFKKCEPKDIIYQLDYNPDSISQKDEYVQIFNDCGWEYLQNYAEYSYFRKVASDIDKTEEIFCDDVSRLDMMKRVFAGRMIPLLVVFFSIIIRRLLCRARLIHLSTAAFWYSSASCFYYIWHYLYHLPFRSGSIIKQFIKNNARSGLPILVCRHGNQ